jgi:hypothetical protein
VGLGHRVDFIPVFLARNLFKTTMSARKVTSSASVSAPEPVRPKGMPRAEWNGMSARARRRFLDFSISTASSNSGTQQFGAGQSIRSGKVNVLRQIVPDTVSTRALAVPRSNARIADAQVNKTLIFEETEVITSVNGTSAFSILSLPVNPGLSTFLVKGHRIANNYERYRFNRLEILFVPTVSGFANQGEQGRVVLAASLDALEAAPSSIEAMESMDPHKVTMPYQGVELSLDNSSLNSTLDWRYTRSALAPAGSDLKTYDPAIIHFGVQGCTGTGQIGELHVHYVLELRNIRQDATPTLPPNRTLTRLLFADTVPVNATPVRQHAGGIYGSPPVNGLGLVYAVHPGTGTAVFYFPTGRYRVIYHWWVDTTASIQAFYMKPTANTAIANPFSSQWEGSGFYNTAANVDNRTGMFEEIVDVASWDGVTLTGTNWRAIDLNVLGTGTMLCITRADVMVA